MKKNMNPNDNFLVILIWLVVILVGTLVGSHIYTKKKLNETYTTRSTIKTYRIADEYVPHKPRFKITLEPLEE